MHPQEMVFIPLLANPHVYNANAKIFGEIPTISSGIYSRDQFFFQQLVDLIFLLRGIHKSLQLLRVGPGWIHVFEKGMEWTSSSSPVM